MRTRSLYRRFLAFVLRPTAPPLWLGVLVAAGFIAVEIVLVVGLKKIAPNNAFGALFLLGVLVVSAGWGFGLAVATSLVSALVYSYFHLEGADTLAPSLAVFLCLALLANVLAGQARLRTAEAEQRRSEADLSAELARSTLRAEDLEAALDGAGQRIAEMIGLPFAELGLVEMPGDDDRLAVPLRDGGEQVGTLVVPAASTPGQRERVQRMLPSLEALVVATRDRREIHAEVSALARQQAALRRVATLVAGGAEPEEMYPVAVAELARGLEVEHVTLLAYDGDDCVVLAARDIEDRANLVAGERFRLDGRSVGAEVLRTGTLARVDDYREASGEIAARMQGLGMRSGVGAPIVVDGQLRGVLIVGSAVAGPLPREYEAHVCDFADLVSTAIHNAETKNELKASRARIVAAADQARRGFERDLHDGAQQRLLALGLDLRVLETSVPEECRDAVGRAVNALTEVHAELQQLSRGMHPAVLSKHGLGPAITALARRSPVPVKPEIDVGGRLPEAVEVAAYYVVAEALTNTVKHGHASSVRVSATTDNECLRVLVGDDGVGGAVFGGGSGLIGLKDRVEAVSGWLEVSSPAGRGTTLMVTIPVH